jgi:toxin CcdB
MARFDVHRGEGAYLLDCQADVLGYLHTRFVVPLVPADGARCADRLNPIFTIEEEPLVMATQLAAAVPTGEPGRRIASLPDEHARILEALDMPITGS